MNLKNKIKKTSSSEPVALPRVHMSFDELSKAIESKNETVKWLNTSSTSELEKRFKLKLDMTVPSNDDDTKLATDNSNFKFSKFFHSSFEVDSLENEEFDDLNYISLETLASGDKMQDNDYCKDDDEDCKSDLTKITIEKNEFNDVCIPIFANATSSRSSSSSTDWIESHDVDEYSEWYSHTTKQKEDSGIKLNISKIDSTLSDITEISDFSDLNETKIKNDCESESSLRSHKKKLIQRVENVCQKSKNIYNNLNRKIKMLRSSFGETSSASSSKELSNKKSSIKNVSSTSEISSSLSHVSSSRSSTSTTTSSIKRVLNKKIENLKFPFIKSLKQTFVAKNSKTLATQTVPKEHSEIFHVQFVESFKQNESIKLTIKILVKL